MTDAPLFVSTADRLAELCRSLSGCDWLAVDTEFIREQTYYPRLCLVQVAVPGTVALIDPLAIEDLTPLRDLLLDGATTKVFHAASQDLEIFYHLWGEVPAPLFDTQIAATMLGYGEQTGYGSIVETVLGITLDKGHTRTDWSRRPLDSEQAVYAADDVIHLCDIYVRLRADLERLGRIDWLEEDFSALADPARYRPDPATAWRRLRGARNRPDRERAVAAALAAWREETAMEVDKPRRWILADDVILDLARMRPGDRDGLAAIRGLNDGVIRRHGERLLALVREGSTAEPPPAGERRPRRAGPADDALTDALMALLRLRCAGAGISPSIVAARKEIEALAAGERESSLLHGWRAHIAGDALLDFLEGRNVLATAEGRLTALSGTANR